MASHRREGHCAQRNHRKSAGRKNAGHKQKHTPGRGQDRSKTEKFSQQSETSSKWNMCSAIQWAQHRQATSVKYMGVDLRGSDVRMPEQLLHGANILACFQKMRGKGMT
jgi:hypothetical protein